jgi:hypothetical protein
MRQLLYTSNTNRDLSEKVLADILTASRRNNKARGITGLLLYIDGGFLQVLEGPDEDVQETFLRIKQDTRHWDTKVLLDRQAERAFADWSMGFERPTESGPSEGVFRATADAIAGKPNLNAEVDVIILLKTFYRVQTGAM